MNDTIEKYKDDNFTLTLLQSIYTLACSDPPQSDSSSSSSDVDAGGTPSLVLQEYDFLNYYMGLDEIVRMEIGHQFDDFISSCTFAGKDCTNERWYFVNVFLVTSWYFSNFEYITSALYGNCFAFNSDMYANSSSTRSSSLTGPVMGLTLILNLEQYDYMKNGLTTSAGARYYWWLYHSLSWYYS